jgi:SAM-dependent methyltransferase
MVVDLACGTGLGLDLVRSVNAASRYVGVDISPQMLAGARSSVAHVAAAMDQVPLRSSSADAVLVLFTSCSFAYELTSLLNEVARLLKPGGIGYLSVLSRTALSRMLWPKNWDGHYRTRGDGGELAAPVNRATVQGMRTLVSSVGLELVSVDALNAFSGVFEHRLLWAPGRLVGRVSPSLSHSLEVTVRKPPARNEP